MTAKEMSHYPTKPKFYENHATLLQQSMLEPQAISLYLHENMLNFYESVADIAETWDVYSSLDGEISKLEYQYGNQQYLAEIEQLNSIIESMAITEYNLNGADHKDTKKNVLLQMQVP